LEGAVVARYRRLWPACPELPVQEQPVPLRDVPSRHSDLQVMAVVGHIGSRAHAHALQATQAAASRRQFAVCAN